MTNAKTIIKCYKNGGKLLVCGNGGSATMASHLVGELMGKFEHERQPLPAISLFDLATITAIANDYDYEDIFARQVRALGKKGDVLVIFSTSGESKNLIQAEFMAIAMEMEVIEAPIAGQGSARIQELQLIWLHDLCREVEEAFL